MRGDRGVLHLDEIADVHILGQHRAGPQARERPDDRMRADHGVLDHAVRVDAHAVLQLDAALEDAIDVDEHVAAADQLAAHVDAVGIGERDALRQQRLGDVALMDAFEPGQLVLAVDAIGFPVVVRLGGRDLHAFGHGHGHDVGQVVLALRVAVAEQRQPARQRRARRDEDAGVDLADRALGVVSILLLDDAGHFSIDADDAAIAPGILEMRSEQGQPVFARAGDQALQGLHAGERHIAIQYQSRRWRDGIDMRQGLQNRMAGAQLRLLQGPGDIRRGELLRHALAAMAIDNADFRCTELACGVEHMGQQRLAGERVQHLRQVGTHARSFPGGQYDDIQHDAASLSARQRGSVLAPMRNSSTARAHWRPSRIAHTTSDWPRRMSPAAKTLATLVA